MDSAAPENDYEVYLSFRGGDIQQGFADVLYELMDRAGIRVFRDENELSIGDKIEKTLQVIYNSQICVPIFSRTFAKSKWCLDEVRKMVELKKDVVPIFYDVTPDDVSLKTPAWSEFMAEHETVYGKDRVEDWKAALRSITEFKRREVSDTSYIKFSKMFVEELLAKLKRRRVYDLDTLVGINDQLETAMNLLDIRAGGVRYMIIHGMGGIGKTTLAQVIFNKLSASFDGCSFLENLQESSRREGLDYLQKQLGDNLDQEFATISSLSRDIKDRFYRKKVLIVLDDVEAGEQIERLVRKSWFASGSRIIITTRNLNILNECGDFDDDSARPFEMRTLGDDESLQLFITYALRRRSPPAVDMNLCREAASTTGGLPLAIKVLASLLRGKDERVWRDVIARSKKIPPEKVKNRLRISYDALEHDQRQMFLDIACFFDGMEKSNPCYMWEACDFYPVFGLEVLVSMSLVKITEENVISMHHQLRDLGRDIVREESIAYPLKRSRLWLPQEARKALLVKEGKEVIEAISLRERLVGTLTAENFASFQSLRFLEMAGVNVEGNFEKLLTNLIWFSWHLCPSSFDIRNFYLESLVILDLSYSTVDESWGGWGSIQMIHNLKVLDLRRCRNLTRTPDFSENGTLERLILSGCTKLATIDGSIGKLRSLMHLDLKDCHSLTGFPEQFGSLEALKELIVSGDFNETFHLPEAIGDLRSLITIRLEDLKIVNIPNTIGRLVKLKYLSILNCHGMDELPESLGDLESLIKLDLSWTGMTALPASMGRLVRLKELCMHGCSEIEELPDTLGDLRSLVNLDLSKVELLHRLPDSIGGLQELRVMNISDCYNLQKLPRSVGSLKKLEELNASFCYFLEEVPDELWELSSLRKLKLAGSRIQTVPSTVGQLRFLEELDVEGCSQLEELLEVPPTLTTLRASCGSLHKIPDLSQSTSLSILSFPIVKHSPEQFEIEKVQGIQKLTKLKFLGLRLWNVASVPFDLGSLTQLEALFLALQPPLSTSVDLVFSPYGTEEIELPSLSKLRNLSCIRLRRFLMEDERLESLGVRDLERLDDVWIENCSGKLIEVCLVKNLRYLIITGCQSLQALPDLSHLRALTHFQVCFCKELTGIPGLGELETLLHLSFESCESLETLGNLSKLKKLSLLSLLQCKRLRHIEGVDGLFVGEIRVAECDSIENMEELKERCKVGIFDGIRVQNYKDS